MMNARLNSKTFLLLAAALLLSPFWLHADPCTLCPQIEDLMKRMDKVKPDPMNAETLEAQDELSGEALVILQKNLNEKQFTPGNAKAIVKMIAKTIPYDNSLDFERVNMKAFRKLYDKPGSLLKSTIESMKKSGEISTKERDDILDLFGVK